MLKCFDIANYFLSLVDEDSGDLISNLKLQKLVYYAQGFWLALKGKPLFGEAIEAWAYGPVIPELYRQYKKYGQSPLKYQADIDFSVYPKEVTDFLNEIYSYYGQFSAWRLSEITHAHPTWINHYTKDDPVMTCGEMEAFFKTELKD